MKIEIGDWKKELARDFLALGSWVFFILVIARAFIKPYRPFVDQIIIAGIVLLILGLLIKKQDGYISKGLVLVYFTSIFYQDNVFTGFAILAMGGLLASSYYLNKNIKRISLGLFVGLVGILAGYYLVGFY